MPASLDERELVRRTLGGDREAFRVIVLRHQQALAELVFRQTGDRAGAEDMVQETFLRAYQALDRFDPRFRLSTWLSRIALNVATDQHRKRQVRDAAAERVEAQERLLRDPHAARPDREAAAREARETVSDALLTLPESQREVLVLSVYAGLSQREIADALDLPLGTVKSRTRAALTRLRDLVAPLRPGGAA